MDSLQPTILIVDDEKHTRDGLRRLLENDYDVYVAADIAGAMWRTGLDCEISNTKKMDAAIRCLRPDLN